MFDFKGSIATSKSQLLRVLLMESYGEAPFIFYGENPCDDVTLMRQALARLKERKIQYDCGESAAVFRFLALRLSRLSGRFELHGSERLLSRGHDSLEKVLRDLGVAASFEKDKLVVEGDGWKAPDALLEINASQSSQVLSSLFLNSWSLPFPLKIRRPREIASLPYFEMTLELLAVHSFEMDRIAEDIVRVPEGQLPRPRAILHLEPDMSSAFAVAAMAVANGRAEIEAFPVESLQADFLFPGVLAKMGVSLRREEKRLIVEKPQQLKGLDLDLGDMPDLFPVLAVLCAHASESSRLSGAQHLRLKESDRIATTMELLQKCGAQCEELPDGLGITPTKERCRFDFDVSLDHRLAMAAAVAQHFGHEITLTGKESVAKSFPNFWTIASLPDNSLSL